MGGGSRHEASSGRLARLALVLLSAVLSIGLVAAASAQDPTDPDTELTPKPRELTKWSLVGGAKYRAAGKPVNDGSPTDHTVDFFTTSFSPTYIDEGGNETGFFGGAECVDEVEFNDEALRSCTRRPAIYRFWVDEVGDEHIDKVPTDELVDDPEKEGFVGAIAWIDGNRALAVGGTKKYPRREPSTPDPDPSKGEVRPGESPDAAYLRKDKEKGAGHARAWLYEDPDGEGDQEPRWKEITGALPKDKDNDGTGAEEPMGALSALECTHHQMTDGGPPKGTCLAGGLQRMWEWKPKSETSAEGFGSDPGSVITNREVTGASTPLLFGLSAPNPSTAPDFHHRVRQIRFAVDGIAAVTSGCCVERVQTKTGTDGLPSEANAALGGRLLTFPMNGKKWQSASFSQLRGEDAARAGAPMPDSVLGLAGTVDPRGDQTYEDYVLSGVVSLGGEPQPGSEEPGSRIVSRTGTQGLSTDGTSDLSGRGTPAPVLDSVRLMAGDGDKAGVKGPGDDAVISSPSNLGADGVLDWAVGSLKQGSADGTAQGVAYTTTDPLLAAPAPYSCPLVTFIQQEGGSCELVRENITEASLKSRRLIGMGTYALNSISFVFKSPNAWAVGDRGAIARLGGAGKLGSEVEPDPPKLKPGRSKPLAERAPFEPSRPEAGEPGAVPPIASRPTEQLSRDEMVPYGSADPSRFRGSAPGQPDLPWEVVTSMAMSRDGSEGWAIGSGGQRMHQYPYAGHTFTLQRFDGERWVRCAIDGLDGAHEPDRACDSLAGLYQRGDRPFLSAITRIPLERDGDPTNDDDFEAIAIGTRPSAADLGTKSTVLAYRDGIWGVDQDASRIINGGTVLTNQASIAFRSPDDGWLVINSKDSGSIPRLYHYGGGDWPNGRWVSCAAPSAQAPPPPECGGASALSMNLEVPEGDPSAAKEVHIQIVGNTVFAAGYRASGGSYYPFVFSKEPEKPWRAEYDPGCFKRTPHPTGASTLCQARAESNATLDNARGIVYGFSAVELEDGKIGAWLLGRFGIPPSTAGFEQTQNSDEYTRPAFGPKHMLMRRDPDAPPGSSDAWSFRETKDAAEDFLPSEGHRWLPPQLVGFRGKDGRERAVITPAGSRGQETFYPPLEYDAGKDRWQVLPVPFSSGVDLSERDRAARIGRVAPDGEGGLWVAASVATALGTTNPAVSHQPTFYYRYTDRRPKAVFEDSPSPINEKISDLEGTPDGTVWVSTETDRLYRYDRIAGWERISIPEWDPGRVVTRRSKALALAVNDSGHGIVVGEAGRIANISPNAVTLDAASVNRCSERPPPCGTPRDLRAAAVAPDGSAIAGGIGLTTTWRPAGGQFRLIDGPRSNASASITDLSMPDPAHVWATLNNGEIWAGTLVDPGGERPWRWLRESGAIAVRDERGLSRLYGIEVDSLGRGLAVGLRGAIMERSTGGSWKRLVTGFLDNLYTVELPPRGYGDGTLIGGDLGVVLTRADGRFLVARRGDFYEPATLGVNTHWGGQIVGLAISGGPDGGETEAWAASQVNSHIDLDSHNRRTPDPQVLLHYSPEDNPVLNPEARATPLSDAPEERPGELTLAAFGRSECQLGSCPPFAGTNLFNEVISRRINEEIAERTKRSSNSVLAVSTGDLNEAAGQDREDATTASGFGGHVHTVNQPNMSHHQWKQFVADPLLENGIPVLGALGERDLSRARLSTPSAGYRDTRELVGGGIPTQWREAFVGMPAPWGTEEHFSNEGYEYRPVPGPPTAVEHPPDQTIEDPTKPVPDQDVKDPTKDVEDPVVEVPRPGNQQVGTTTVADPTKGIPDQRVPLTRPGDQSIPPRTGDQTVHTDGAHTHYALDVIRKSDGKAISRVVVVDTSMARSLAASDANQNPAEPQQAWLEQVLCIKGTAGAVCTRPDDLPAVVVTTTPTYSYGAGAVEQTQAEAASFEALMLRHRVTALITGHMGWNGLYYTFAPSLHYPQPGGEHPDSTNPPSGPGDDRAPDPGPLPVDLPDQSELSGESPVSGVLPTVIASSAGGRFGPRGEDEGTASEGYWHGYSVVRVPADGDPRKVIVEQRPILDWINITAKSHVLRPGQRLDLEGIGREPYGIDSTIRINEIDSHAITHRYDLVLADPEKPWLPLKAEDAEEEQLTAAGPGDCAPYLCMSSSVGTINRQTGDVRAGGGEQERTFGIAVLSVGEQTATWPIAFEPRPSFSPPRVPPPPPPQPPPPPPVPANPPVGTVGNLNLPTPPALPSLPLGAELVPPAPPIPPPPPGAANVAPLNLFLSVPGINIAPQSTVVPPPAPPIQPAPPGGARKEARQRQAAAQKSGSEADQGASDMQDAGGDLANSPPTQANAATRNEFTSRDRAALERSFTPAVHREQPSAWVTGLQWGGGMTLMVLVLGFGWITVRPTPRRREPELPAPAWARNTRPRR